MDIFYNNETLYILVTEPYNEFLEDKLKKRITSILNNFDIANVVIRSQNDINSFLINDLIDDISPNTNIIIK